MQHEAWPSLTCLTNFLVEFFFLPSGDPLRLAFGEVAAHRKRSISEIQGVLIVGHGSQLKLKVVFGGFNVAGNLRLQGVEVGKFHFVAQLVQKANVKVGTVNILIKVK